MELTLRVQEEINGMSYEEMLTMWRRALSGNPMFEGDSGWHFSRVMAEKREKVGNEEHVRISKKIGFGG